MTIIIFLKRRFLKVSDKIVSIAEGVEGLFIENNRFNTTSISYNFYLPLKAETVAENALLPFILTASSQKYPDFSAEIT